MYRDVLTQGFNGTVSGEWSLPDDGKEEDPDY